MSFKIGIYLFDEFTTLDAMGPWDVFSYAAKEVDDVNVMMISEQGKSVISDTGLEVMAHKSINEINTLDLLLIPGGLGTRREINKKPIIEWIQKVAPSCRYIITSAGVSGGIDMSLWLVGQLWGKAQARKTRARLQYEPAPPYTAELDNDY